MIHSSSILSSHTPFKHPNKVNSSPRTWNPIKINLSNHVSSFITPSNDLGSCSCGRRHFIETSASTLLLPMLFPTPPTNASNTLPSRDYIDVLNRVHPPRPDWYEELYASVLSSGMKAYEEEIALYKSQLFSNLKGRAKRVLEIGIGTGPNLKYYVSGSNVQVFGMDPNRKMERYAKESALAAGLKPENFVFVRGVVEAIPMSDASVDAVIGTLVLCSVQYVDQALKEVKRVLKPGGFYVFVEHVAAKEGTGLRFVQNILDPLQQAVADGCHLTRDTGKEIAEAGFAGVDLNMTFLSSASIINPHLYGIARR